MDDNAKRDSLAQPWVREKCQQHNPSQIPLKVPIQQVIATLPGNAFRSAAMGLLDVCGTDFTKMMLLAVISTRGAMRDHG